MKQKLIGREDFLKDWKDIPMRKPYIESVIVNFAVGESGTELEKARALIEKLTGQKPTECYSKKSIRTYDIRKGEPIGVKTTLRGEKAITFLKSVIWAKNDELMKKSFDQFGNIAIGMKEHLDLPKTRYDPKIGVHGFTTTVVLERPGYRIKRRRYQRKKIPQSHRISKEEAIVFFTENFEVKIIE